MFIRGHLLVLTLIPMFNKILVETTGNIIDRDSELVLFFNLPDTECYAEGCPVSYTHLTLPTKRIV